MEQVIVATALPNLRVHDDGAIESHHLKLTGSTLRRCQFIMARNHVMPPSLFQVAFEFDSERSVVPKARTPPQISLD